MADAQQAGQKSPRGTVWAIPAAHGAVFAFCSHHCRDAAQDWIEGRFSQRPEARQVQVGTCTWCAGCGGIAYAPAQACRFCDTCADRRWEYTFNAVATVAALSTLLEARTGDGRVNDTLLAMAAQTASRARSLDQVIEELWARRAEWAD
jgi:hypothetical protein